jgi:hypothetical protein
MSHDFSRYESRFLAQVVEKQCKNSPLTCFNLFNLKTKKEQLVGDAVAPGEALNPAPAARGSHALRACVPRTRGYAPRPAAFTPSSSPHACGAEVSRATRLTAPSDQKTAHGRNPLA